MDLTINFLLFIMGLIMLLFGPLIGVMALKNGNPGLGLSALIIGPTVGPALMFTAM